MVTTIQINNDLKDQLDSMKIHHRETYNDLISRLVNLASQKEVDRESLIETIEVLSDPEGMRDIAEALDQYNQGKGVDFEDLKKELKLNV